MSPPCLDLGQFLKQMLMLNYELTSKKSLIDHLGKAEILKDSNRYMD